MKNNLDDFDTSDYPKEGMMYKQLTVNKIDDG
jgi:hypothetical protein